MISNEYLHEFAWNKTLTDIQSASIGLIDNNATEKVAAAVNKNHVIILRMLDNFPNIIESVFSLKILAIQIFAMLPNKFGGIHKDGIDRKSAFNIPLLNCDKGIMQWFEPCPELNGNQVNSFTDYTNVRLSVNSMTPRKSDFETLIEYPSIVNVDEWHCIDNRDSDKLRYVLSIRFVGNLPFDELVDISGNNVKLL